MRVKTIEPHGEKSKRLSVQPGSEHQQILTIDRRSSVGSWAIVNRAIYPPGGRSPTRQKWVKSPVCCPQSAGDPAISISNPSNSIGLS